MEPPDGSVRFVVRNETDTDVNSIAEVTAAAFATLAISQQTEQFIVAALRRASALTISLVAEANDRMVGHVASSPVTISNGTLHWYGLGPQTPLGTVTFHDGFQAAG